MLHTCLTFSTELPCFTSKYLFFSPPIFLMFWCYPVTVTMYIFIDDSKIFHCVVIFMWPKLSQIKVWTKKRSNSYCRLLRSFFTCVCTVLMSGNIPKGCLLMWDLLKSSYVVVFQHESNLCLHSKSSSLIEFQHVKSYTKNSIHFYMNFLTEKL